MLALHLNWKHTGINSSIAGAKGARRALASMFPMLLHSHDRRVSHLVIGRVPTWFGERRPKGCGP